MDKEELCCRWGRKGKAPEGRSRGEREIGFPKDLCVNLDNCRDLFVKSNFPLI
jgi:hypothetical protein